MFITNKRVQLPSFVTFNHIKLEVVPKFKLLGITIDRKLSFNDFSVGLSSAINKKHFAIKRIFYLADSVKLQFFKTFILPYFDFGLSLIIYFSKYAIHKLEKTYYNCIYKLFKINVNCFDVFGVNKKLEDLNLNSFQHRVFQKLTLFAFKIKYSLNAPKTLKEVLDCKRKTYSHNLRETSKEYISQLKNNSSYGDLTFKSFFAKFFNKQDELLDIFLNYNFADYDSFKSIFLSKIDILLENFLYIFPRFGMNINLKIF